MVSAEDSLNKKYSQVLGGRSIRREGAGGGGGARGSSNKQITGQSTCPPSPPVRKGNVGEGVRGTGGRETCRSFSNMITSVIFVSG